jgi:hypothetical protein
MLPKEFAFYNLKTSTYHCLFFRNEQLSLKKKNKQLSLVFKTSINYSPFRKHTFANFKAKNMLLSTQNICATTRASAGMQGQVQISQKTESPQAPAGHHGHF